MKDEFFPLKPSLVMKRWAGGKQEVEEADDAAKKWIELEGLAYTAAMGSTPTTSAFISAKALLLEEIFQEQIDLMENGVFTFSSPAKTAEQLLLLMWKKIAPASKGWNNERLQAALKTIADWGIERE